ncbi:MAG: hypothetical protein KJ914_09160 [Gammaproteobacteria bacterium]|nr:hypothetical protein [Gammaproteobacteria bacterium]MBU1723648.1 hypothetical protein [Gammaproteobacteria bacterium]MBU2005644.1 hypothetical protein [Gammaproteobacteria bacterium]
MNPPYDHYIEPCQLCISRNGATYDKCGWCHDDDTHYRPRDGQYPGDYIRIPEGGYGYPFHAMPHPTRQYYRDGKHLPEMDGITPPDCEPGDADGARSSVAAGEKILEMFNSGARPAWPIEPEKVSQFLTQVTTVEQELAYNPTGLDVTGKVEFRYLTYTLMKVKPEELADIFRQAREFCSEDPADYPANLPRWEQARQSGKANIPVLEVVCHEAFHIIQATTMPVVGMRFDAERRLAMLKLLLVEDFYLDRQGTSEYGNGLYELLEQADPESEIYHPLSRLFGYCCSDIRLISDYAEPITVGINLFDLIEGSAYFFQKLLFQPDYHPDRCPEFAALPPVYTRAWQVFREMDGDDPLDFLIFCHLSLLIGLIVDEDDINQHVLSPLMLFVGLLKIRSELDDFPQRLPPNMPLSRQTIREVLETVGFERNADILLEHLSHRPAAQVWRFVDIAVRVWSTRNRVFDFMKAMGLSRSEYNNFADLAGNMDDARKGFADERRQAVKQTLEQRFPLVGGDILLPLLLAFELDALLILLDVNDLTKQTEFTGLLGTEQVTVERENALLDLTERLDDYLQEKSVFCCAEHGLVAARDIPSCENADSLRHMTENIFQRKLSDLTQFV